MPKRGLWLYAGSVALLALSSYHAMRKVEGLSYYAAARNLTYERKMQSANPPRSGYERSLKVATLFRCRMPMCD